MERSTFQAAEHPASPTAAASSASPPDPPAGSPGMELPDGGDGGGDVAAGIWDWGNLLDFTIEADEPFVASWEEEDGSHQPSSPSSRPIARLPLQDSSPGSSIQTSTTSGEPRTATGGPSRVRKRDPRLVCENFVSGRIPCACPEADRKAEEEEEQAVKAAPGGGRKKVRTGGTTAVSRCQVPGCGVDISELKGYHRRHRVCLRCANASSVFLDGESKRYCQQCGKFHILPDFDEGKRSCRRKLERHNRRRRRRSTDHTAFVESDKEPVVGLPPNVAGEDEQTKAVEIEHEERETSPSFHAIHSIDAAISLPSDEIQKEEKIEKTNSAVSSSMRENKIVYSSMCPTGRVSFKLYDWNPADFPRRLRHQIFQWLSSMPVELEGYIRPGCVILTLFIAMPQSAWDNLSEESSTYVNYLLTSPDSLFFGRGNMLIYLKEKIFQVMNDGSFLANIKMEMQGPKIHYVHPNCFEAGKPAEFLLCGSNLLGRKFRSLVSFSGRYLNHELCGVVSRGRIEACRGTDDSDHQMLLIRILCTDADAYGPGFIEVENERGTSNFVPILFGNRGACSEMMRMQGSVNGTSLTSDMVSQSTDAGSISRLCCGLSSRQAPQADLLVDCAWLLKKSTPDEDETLSDKLRVHRLNRLLEHLLRTGSLSILESSMGCFEACAENNEADDDDDSEVKRLVDQIGEARKALHRRDSQLSSGGIAVEKGGSPVSSSTLFPRPVLMPATSTAHRALPVDQSPPLTKIPLAAMGRRDECYPLLASDWQQQPWLRGALPGRRAGARLALLAMVMALTCCGVCVVLLHPHKAGDFMVTVRRCLFGAGR